MHKKVILYLTLIIITGCSVSKIRNNSNTDNKPGSSPDALQKNNITNNSFFIQKAEVDLVSENQKESFLISIKFSKPDTFLISIKSKTGIEAARIFIAKDTLLINDRINRILYYGSGSDLKRKFGYSSRLLPALFGDLVLMSNSYKTMDDCADGIFDLITSYEGFRLKYLIDCNSGRLKKLELSDELDTNSIVLNYSDTRRKDQIYYYSRIFITEFREYKYLNINIRNIEIPYTDKIKFVPGKNYEMVRIK